MAAAAMAGAAGAIPGAGSPVRTADTFDAFLLLLSDVEDGAAQNYSNNRDNDDIFHRLSYFFRAYSAASFLSAFLHRQIRTTTIAATAISPGTKPAPSVPAVIRVPIW